jgi:hypothetical protein
MSPEECLTFFLFNLPGFQSMRKQTLRNGLLCALLSSTLCLQAQPQSQESEKGCLHFAQAFYNWYVAEVFKDFGIRDSGDPWHAALKYKGNPFSPELTQALIDSEAEAKVDGDPVLDFDPILNSQDPAEHYVVKKVTYKNGHYWVEVYGVWSRPVAPEEEKRPQVIAEVIFKDGRWQFVNFHYPDSTHPDSTNLLSILGYHYQPK